MSNFFVQSKKLMSSCCVHSRGNFCTQMWQKGKVAWVFFGWKIISIKTNFCLCCIFLLSYLRRAQVRKLAAGASGNAQNEKYQHFQSAFTKTTVVATEFFAFSLFSQPTIALLVVVRADFSHLMRSLFFLEKNKTAYCKHFKNGLKIRA